MAHVNRKTVIILGAGASKAAGVPIMSEFIDTAEDLLHSGILGEDEQHFKDVFEGIYQLSGIFAKSELNTTNLESVFVAFEMGKLLKKLGALHPDQITQLPNRMRRLIVRTIEETAILTHVDDHIMPLGGYEYWPNIMRCFLNKGQLQDLSVITFNYDCLLDLVIEGEGLHVNYHLLDDETAAKERSLNLFKLHGSMNWTAINDSAVIPCRIRKKPQTIRSGDSGSTYHLRFTNALREIQENKGKENADGDCLIVPPTWDKAQYRDIMAKVWQDAAEKLRDAENIIICGFSLPSTDEFFRYLFALGTAGKTRIRNIAVCDPYANDELDKRFRCLFGTQTQSRYQLFKIKFGQMSGALSGCDADTDSAIEIMRSHHSSNIIEEREMN